MPIASGATPLISNMHPFKLSAGFYILFTALTLIPATWLAQVLQSALNNSSVTLLHLLAQSRGIEAPSTVVIIGVLFWIYERYLWRIPFINALHGVPYIAGRYDGHVESSYDGKKYPIVMEVHQTLTSVTVCLYTERSPSYSMIANIGKNGNTNNFLAYVYKNTPRTVRDDLDMRAHDGFACLEIFDAEQKLEGYYHNDPRERPTHGKLTCVRVSRTTKGHF